MRYLVFVTALALLSACPAFARHEHGTTEAEAGNPDKVICKRMEETGSLVRKPRACKSRATWEKEGAAARSQVQGIQDNALINRARPN